MCSRIAITLEDGETFEKEKTDYEGFHTRPAGWETIEEKFAALAGERVDDGLRREIVEAVKGLEEVKAEEMAGLLARIKA
jgi:2-methylcitrate dehydratase